MAPSLASLTELSLPLRWRQGAMLCVALAMLGALGWQGQAFYRQMTSAGAASQAAATATDTAPARDRNTGKALDALFGGSDAGATGDHPPGAELPESTLDIQVSAIFFVGTPGSSSVILEDGDKTLMLRPGEEVRAGVTLEGVEARRITLKRNGKYEQVTFRGFDQDGGGSNDSPHLPTVDNSPPAAPLAQQAGTQRPPTAAPPPPAYQQLIQRKLAQNK